MTVKKSRRALGRGLSHLIPIDSPDKGSDDNVLFVDVNSIKANPFQPRKDFNDEDIKGLAESIDQQGLLQPIVLRKNTKGYDIISGERRFRALKHLNRTKVPAIIKTKITDEKMLEMALVENIQREDLNSLEVAISYQQLLFDCGLSHQQLSERVGKSRSAITNVLRLLKLPEKIQELLRFGKISMGHARALLALKDEEKQFALADRIISQELSVRDIESITQDKFEKTVKKQSPPQKKQKTEEIEDPDLIHQQEKLQYRFGTDVKIINNNSYKGKIEISYYNKDDLDRVLDLMIP